MQNDNWENEIDADYVCSTTEEDLMDMLSLLNEEDNRFCELLDEFKSEHYDDLQIFFRVRQKFEQLFAYCED